MNALSRFMTIFAQERARQRAENAREARDAKERDEAWRRLAEEREKQYDAEYGPLPGARRRWSTTDHATDDWGVHLALGAILGTFAVGFTGLVDFGAFADESPTDFAAYATDGAPLDWAAIGFVFLAAIGFVELVYRLRASR